VQIAIQCITALPCLLCVIEEIVIENKINIFDYFLGTVEMSLPIFGFNKFINLGENQ